MIRKPEDRILHAASEGLKYQAEYEGTVAELAEVRLKKCIQYGEARYEIDPDNWTKQNWLCYSDVYRKFIRLDQQMETGSTEDLLETYQDLANYAIMAVQLLRRRK